MATPSSATATASTMAQLRYLTDAAHLLRQTAPETSAYLLSRRAALLAQSAMVATTVATSSVSSASSSSAQAAQAAVAFTQTDAQRQHVCTGCGHILIPGSNGTTLVIEGRLGNVKKVDKKKIEKKKIEKDQKKGITKVFACGACSRETRIALPPPPPLPKNRRPRKAAAAVTRRNDNDDDTPTLENSPVPDVPPPPPPPPAAAAASAPTTAPAKSSNASSKKRAKNRKAGLLALLDKSKGSDSGFGGFGLGLSLDDFRKK